MCGSCIANVTPVLNEEIGVGKWQVNIQSPDKILSVTTDSLVAQQVIEAVKKAGYKAELL